MNSVAHLPESHTPLQRHWTTYTAKELDDMLPGCIDGIGLLGGVANTIMQLAHPGVGRGVVESKVESGSIMHHPFKRTRTTLTFLSVAAMGNDEEKLAYRKSINRAHAQVRSTSDSPVQYNAFDPQLQLWVAACIYKGYKDAYERFRGPMSEEQAALLYHILEPMGTTLQVRPGMWPADVQAFERYWDEHMARLSLDNEVKAFLNKLVDMSFLGEPYQFVLQTFGTFMTSGFLAPEMRRELGLSWNAEKQRRFERITATIGGVNRRLPRVVRQFPGNLLMWEFRRRLRKGLPLN